MNTEEIIAGNKLIAEFDGWTIEEGMEKESDPFYNREWNMCILSAMKYHASWEWLMAVVEKIEKLESCRFGFTIDVLGVWITDYNNDEKMIENVDRYSVDDTKMEMVWEVVIKFIEWFNRQQNVQASVATDGDEKPNS